MSFSYVDLRREKAEKVWRLKDEIVVIGAGLPISIPGGADQVYPYKPHPQYRWLTDRQREGGVLVFDPGEGWTLFEPPITEAELVWGGGDPPVGQPLGDLTAWLNKRQGRPIANLGCEILSIHSTRKLNEKLGAQLDHIRRAKDEQEIELMTKAANAAAAGHRTVKGAIKPGQTERALQIEFEAAAARGGATGTGYNTIVGTGVNSAVFHFTPGQNQVKENDLVLVDAGAEFKSYVIDVTRTYPANGSFTKDQQWLYDQVRNSEIQSIKKCTAGTEWLDVHQFAAYQLASSLKEGGLFLCSPEEALESEAIAMFLPHGIGHMVGLGVRDASGALPGRNREAKAAGVSIRMDLPLQEGYVVTIEPGLYFIPAILQDQRRRDTFGKQVDWSEVDRWIGTGGIRIEDNILVTSGEPVVLTDMIPK